MNFGMENWENERKWRGMREYDAIANACVMMAFSLTVHTFGKRERDRKGERELEGIACLCVCVYFDVCLCLLESDSQREGLLSRFLEL